MMQKYYKVVHPDLGSLIMREENKVQYKVGEFVYSNHPGKYLYVYSSLSAAQRNTWNGIIYECEVEGLCDSPAYPHVKGDDVCFAYGVKLVRKAEAVRYTYGDKFITSGGLIVTLIQVGPNKFQLITDCYNRIGDKVIEHGSLVPHGVTLEEINNSFNNYFKLEPYIEQQS